MTRLLRSRREEKTNVSVLESPAGLLPSVIPHSPVGPMAIACQHPERQGHPLPFETVQRGICGAGGGWLADVDEACSTNTLRAFSPKKKKREGAGDLLEEKLASVWTGGVDGRKGPCPTKKERRERSDRSGERC